MLWQVVNQIIWHLYVICVYSLVVTLFNDWGAVRDEAVYFADFLGVLVAIARGDLPLV